MPQPVSATTTVTPSVPERRGERQRPAHGHRLAGVERQVEQHLLQLVLVARQGGQLAPEVLDDGDLAELLLTAHQQHGLPDDLVEVELGALDRRLPREVEQPADNLAHPRRLPQDRVEVLAVLVGEVRALA